MQLHIVGGFLGSGKTTAILAAACSLMAQGKKVGIITNDQGRFLVDTAFFRLANLPAVEVTGGCFCCHYDDLDARVNELIAAQAPDVIFAESVGSCADLVATVVRPLLELRPEGEPPASFSVFTDSRLLRLYLKGESLPFSEEVLYIFRKQIEEASLLVINKSDLLSETALVELLALAEQEFPEKQLLLQNSLEDQGADAWLRILQSARPSPLPRNLDIDYQRYGEGEAHLAWRDEKLRLVAPAGGADASRFIEALVTRLTEKGYGIGHLKFIFEGGNVQVKLSIPAIEEPGWQQQLAVLPAGEIHVLLNARLEMPADDLEATVAAALSDSGLAWTSEAEDCFHPGWPKPTHRIQV